MKYFKITNLTTNEIFHMAAMALNEHTMRATLHALNLQKHFNPAHKYSIEEVSFRDYYCFSSTNYEVDDWDDDDWENFQ